MTIAQTKAAAGRNKLRYGLGKGQHKSIAEAIAAERAKAIRAASIKRK